MPGQSRRIPGGVPAGLMGASPDGDVLTSLGNAPCVAVASGLQSGFLRAGPARRVPGAGRVRPRCAYARRFLASSLSIFTVMAGGSGVDRRPVTVRVARWSATHPWRAIAMWVAFVAICFVVGGAVGLNEAEDDMGIGEAGRAESLYNEANFDDPAVENVLITSRSGPLDQAAAGKAATDAVNRMTGRTDVTKVEGPIPAPNGTALLVRVTMAGDPDTADDRVEALRAVTAEVQAANPDVRVEETGGPSISKALDETLGEDFKKAEFL